MILLLASAFAADPCYAFAHENRLETDHFWVEWDAGLISQREAESVAEWAEKARQDYIDLGWPMTDDPVSIVVSTPLLGADSSSGLTRTQPCTDGSGESPRVDLFLGYWEPGYVEGLVAHELGHVAQYGYITPYTDATAMWMWWLESTATWLELKSNANEFAWASTANLYRAAPHVGLHQPQAALLDDVRGGHMYGGTTLVRFLAENYGGDDLIRATWEWGATRPGQITSLPEMLDAMGLDAEAVWAHWMAFAPTMSFGDDQLEGGIEVIEEIRDLPRNEQPAADVLPQGYGLSAVRFGAKAADSGEAISVSFEGDPGVPWQVVLVRVDGIRAKSALLDYTPLDVVDGKATGWISGLDKQSAFLVVSPVDTELVGRTWTWSAETIDDPGPMEGNIVIGGGVDEEPNGCGCQSGESGGLWLLLLAALRRRQNG